MPRNPRNSLTSCFFHIIVQGINKEYIFNKEIYMKKYLFLIKKYSILYGIKIISYCIMNNHSHFLIYTENIDFMSKMMHKVNTIYAKYYNKQENRVGYLFRNRYISQPILTEVQLFHCIAYIHTNPIKAKIADNISNYKYSSYNNYVQKNGIVNDELLKLVFGTSKNYIDQFAEIHKLKYTEKIIDIEEDSELYENIIKNYSKDININNLNYNDVILKELVLELHTKVGLSLREISRRLNKNKDMISRILKK